MSDYGGWDRKLHLPFVFLPEQLVSAGATEVGAATHPFCASTLIIKSDVFTADSKLFRFGKTDSRF